MEEAVPRRRVPYPTNLWEDGGELDPAGFNANVFYARRVPWRAVKDTLSVFEEPAEIDPKGVTLSPGTDIFANYKAIKPLQRDHRGTDPVVVQVPETASPDDVLAMFLAAVHLGCDAEDAEEPADVPPVRYQLGPHRSDRLALINRLLATEPGSPPDSFALRNFESVVHAVREHETGKVVVDLSAPPPSKRARKASDDRITLLQADPQFRSLMTQRPNDIAGLVDTLTQMLLNIHLMFVDYAGADILPDAFVPVLPIVEALQDRALEKPEEWNRFLEHYGPTLKPFSDETLEWLLPHPIVRSSLRTLINTPVRAGSMALPETVLGVNILCATVSAHLCDQFRRSGDALSPANVFGLHPLILAAFTRRTTTVPHDEAKKHCVTVYRHLLTACAQDDAQPDVHLLRDDRLPAERTYDILFTEFASGISMTGDDLECAEVDVYIAHAYPADPVSAEMVLHTGDAVALCNGGDTRHGTNVFDNMSDDNNAVVHVVLRCGGRGCSQFILLSLCLATQIAYVCDTERGQPHRPEILEFLHALTRKTGGLRTFTPQPLECAIQQGLNSGIRTLFNLDAFMRTTGWAQFPGDFDDVKHRLQNPRDEELAGFERKVRRDLESWCFTAPAAFQRRDRVFERNEHRS